MAVKREFSAGGVLVRRMRGRWWLAAIRPRREEGARPVWALPKGLIDPGERGMETAVREVREETGIDGRAVSKLGGVRYVYTWQGERIFKVVTFFLLRPIRGRLGDLPEGMEHEVAEVRWFPLEDAGTRLSYHGEREMAAKALAALTEGE